MIFIQHLYKLPKLPGLLNEKCFLERSVQTTKIFALCRCVLSPGLECYRCGVVNFSALIDVIGSSGIDRSGFRGPGAGLAHIVVKVKVSLIIVVGRNVLLFFINSLGLELFSRKAQGSPPPKA